MDELAELRNSCIGTVDSVSTNEIEVALDIEAPRNVAITNGLPRLFPKINGYVLIPNEVGALVGFIHSMKVEPSKYPARKGLKDFDLIDLPFPLRKMWLTPVGTLKVETLGNSIHYKLDRGVFNFPSLGDSVILPTQEQEKVILENADAKAHVYIGDAGQTIPVKIKVDPDKLFGRHLAVLGNTGSGKSCSVAGLIRWSLEAASAEMDKEKQVNSRFIVLDPNGEYQAAFKDLKDEVTVYRVQLPGGSNQEGEPFQIPAWMWNSREWISYTRAAPGVQRPILTDALSGIKAGRSLEEQPLISIQRNLLGYYKRLEAVFADIGSYQEFKNYSGVHQTLQNLSADAQTYSQISHIENALKDKLQKVSNISTSVQQKRTNGNGFQNAFSGTDLQPVLDALKVCLNTINLPKNISVESGADTPKSFQIDSLANYVLASATTNDRDLRNLTTTLELRIRSLLTDIRLKSIINPDDEISLLDWIEQFLGTPKARKGRVSIIDLSVIPSDIVHMVVAVFARLIFEALQRYRRKNEVELPTTLVLEEAHNFIHYNNDANNGNEMSYAHLCLEIFEKIAREGRKFGLGLLLASQRPSEISQTVLSQCNTFLLHRLVNDKDQEYVKKLVPDHIAGFLRELPNLPTRKAILLGWATQIPLLIEMRKLPDDCLPQSSDPEFWNVWTGTSYRPDNWSDIVQEWQCTPQQGTEDEKKGEGNSDDDLPF